VIVTHATDKDFSTPSRDFHILTYAEIGFAPLSIHGERMGMSRDVLAAFAEKVNRLGDAGSLHPVAALSAVPRPFIRDFTDHVALAEQIKDFLRANAETIHARRIFCDFRTPRVSPHVVRAFEQAIESSWTDRIKDIVIVFSNSEAQPPTQRTPRSKAKQ
jgi:hypothetical protein